MRPVTTAVTLAALLSCGQERGRVKMERPTIRDVGIPTGVVDLHDSRAWSVSADGGMVAAARDFGWRRPGVVVIDVASGAIERHGEAEFIAADRPLWRLPDGLHDPGAQMTFVVPPEDEKFESNPSAAYSATEALSNDGTGVLARLIRSDGGAHLRLQVWNRQTAVTWTTEIEPVPDTAGIALSPSGDAVALVQATDGPSKDPRVQQLGPISVRLYDVRDGRLRWSVGSMLQGASNSWVRQPVGFSDDGAALWIAGSSATSEAMFVEERGAGDGALGRTISVDHVGVGDNDSVGLSHTHLWIASVSYFQGSHLEPRSSWSSDYSLYAIGTRRPMLDTESSAPYRDGEIDRRAVFDEVQPRGPLIDSSVRAMRPTTGGGVVLVQAHGDGLRVTTWKKPPGVREQ